MNYSKLSFENFCFVVELNKVAKPKAYKQACKDHHWRDAMDKEMHALYSNDTFEICELHVGGRAIGSKWVFKIKYKST